MQIRNIIAEAEKKVKDIRSSQLEESSKQTDSKPTEPLVQTVSSHTSDTASKVPSSSTLDAGGIQKAAIEPAKPPTNATPPSPGASPSKKLSASDPSSHKLTAVDSVEKKLSPGDSPAKKLPKEAGDFSSVASPTADIETQKSGSKTQVQSDTATIVDEVTKPRYGGGYEEPAGTVSKPHEQPGGANNEADSIAETNSPPEISTATEKPVVRGRFAVSASVSQLTGAAGTVEASDSLSSTTQAAQRKISDEGRSLQDIDDTSTRDKTTDVAVLFALDTSSESSGSEVKMTFAVHKDSMQLVETKVLASDSESKMPLGDSTLKNQAMVSDDLSDSKGASKIVNESIEKGSASSQGIAESAPVDSSRRISAEMVSTGRFTVEPIDNSTAVSSAGNESQTRQGAVSMANSDSQTRQGAVSMANNEKQARVYRDAVINGAGKELKQTLVDKQSELPRSNSDEFKSTNSSDSLTSVGTIFFDTSSYKSDLIVTSNHSEYPNRIFRVGSSDDVDEGKTFTKRDSPEGSPRKCVSPQAEPSSPRDRSMNDRDFKPGCLDRPASADFTRNAASDQDIFNYPMDLPGERPSSFPSTHVPPDFVSDTSSVASSCHGSPGITPSITPASSFENLLCLYDGKQNRVMCSAAQHIEKSASERSSHRMVSSLLLLLFIC